jgi:hypothetical protein
MAFSRQNVGSVLLIFSFHLQLSLFQLPQLENSSIEKATRGGYVLEEVADGEKN